MIHLDFKAKYTGDSKDEIGILGERMNNLSETLEVYHFRVKDCQ